MSLHVELGKEEWQYVRAVLSTQGTVAEPKTKLTHMGAVRMRKDIIAKIDDMIGEES